ncbi:hypothetical protein BIV57_22480 [Mangrovactinospora gilvigrisea]|uniref:Uncharacterized protein n=1 Tax=Mangrovactinospora gilvigrisea TaxID=1428644 RepID=A0A1J7C6L3_9ACTN|nr:hypothetical protein BIV57_22480 [Mangrovactinospora gilvigrisea]
MITGVGIGLAAACAVGAAAIWGPLGGVLPDGGRSGSRGGGAGGEAAALDSAASDLKAAADRLATVRATAYSGTFSNTEDGPGHLDLTSTPSGLSSGRMTEAGAANAQAHPRTLGLLAPEPGKVFVKGDRGFWEDEGLQTGTKLTAYSDHWVKAPFLLSGQTQLVRSLAPGSVAAAMRQDAAARRVRPAVAATVDGVPVRRIATPDGMFDVTASAPHRLVRISTGGGTSSASPKPSAPGATAPSTPAPSDSSSAAPVAARQADDVTPVASALPAGLELRVSETSPSAAAGFRNGYLAGVGTLGGSVDTDVSFSIPGKVALEPCTTNGCTASATVKNADHRGKGAGQVSAMVTVRVTLDGRTVRTCSIPRTMPPNSSTQVSCVASYTIPASANATTHRVQAEVSAVARGATDSQISGYRSEFAQEWAHPGSIAASPRPTPGSTAPGAGA